jgi:hypothetical protein
VDTVKIGSGIRYQEDMTNQEAFETVAKHLLAQGRRSQLSPEQVEAVTLTKGYAPSSTCVYRGEDGAKCAVGCLIPDEVYDKNMEDKSVSLIAASGPLKDLFKELDMTLLGRLQRLHDMGTVDSWRGQLIVIGRSWYLNTAFLEQM